MELAQLLEQVMRGHASVVEYKKVEHDFSARTFARIEQIEGKTMGWVEKRYQHELPEDIRELAAFARTIRNDLAHSFFTSIDKHSADGRRQAMQALYAAINIFGATNRAIFDAHVQMPAANTSMSESGGPAAQTEATSLIDDAVIEELLGKLASSLKPEQVPEDDVRT